MNLSPALPVGSACFAGLFGRLRTRLFGSPERLFDRAVKAKDAVAVSRLLAEAEPGSPIFTPERRRALAGSLHRLLLPFDVRNGFDLALSPEPVGPGSDPLHGFLWRCRGEPDADALFAAYCSACDFERFEAALPPGAEGAFGLVVRLAHYGDLSNDAALRMLSCLLDALSEAKAPRQLASAWRSIGRSAFDADRADRASQALPFLIDAGALLADHNARSPATFAPVHDFDLDSYSFHGRSSILPDLSWALGILACSGRLGAVGLLASTSTQRGLAKGAIKQALTQFPLTLAELRPDAASAANALLSWPEAFVARCEEAAIFESLSPAEAPLPRSREVRL